MKRTMAVFLLGTLAALGCSKNTQQDKSGTVQLTGGTVTVLPSPDAIRLSLKQAKPSDPEIDAFVIATDQNGIITIQGIVPDERTHVDLVRRVKSMPNVAGVHDQLQVPSSTAGTEAVRSSMMRDQPQAADVVEHLIFMDDGAIILVRGIVPDQATHDALLQSAQKASGSETIRDDMHVSGK
jgi:hypothetical protein